MVEPITIEWDGNGSILAYVISKNLQRRHLNESQRAMIAARIANMSSGRRTDLEPSSNLDEVSTDEAAKNINRRHLSDGQKGMALAELATLEHGANQYRGEDGPIGPSTLSTGRPKVVQLVHLHFPPMKPPSSPGSAPLPSSAPRSS